MKVLNEINKLIIDLIKLKKIYKNLYFEQLEINKKLIEKLEKIKKQNI